MNFPISIIHLPTASIGTLLGADPADPNLCFVRLPHEEHPVQVDIDDVAPFDPDEQPPAAFPSYYPPQTGTQCYVRGVVELPSRGPEDWPNFPCRYLHVFFADNTFEKRPQDHADKPFKIVIYDWQFHRMIKSYRSQEERESDYRELQRTAPHTGDVLDLLYGFERR